MLPFADRAVSIALTVIFRLIALRADNLLPSGHSRLSQNFT
jgi:hypothetical protein